jgi:hypothetical protein
MLMSCQDTSEGDGTSRVCFGDDRGGSSCDQGSLVTPGKRRMSVVGAATRIDKRGLRLKVGMTHTRQIPRSEVF